MELKDNFAQINTKSSIERVAQMDTQFTPLKEIMKFIHKSFYTDIIFLEMPS